MYCRSLLAILRSPILDLRWNLALLNERGYTTEEQVDVPLQSGDKAKRRPPTMRAIREAHERMQASVVMADRRLTEQFVKGRGPGGQKINKTSSAVFLRDEETQLFVKTQATRDLQQNRKIARKLLQLRIDETLHGEDSVLALKRRKVQRNKNRQLGRLRVGEDQESSESILDFEENQVEEEVDEEIDHRTLDNSEAVLKDNGKKI